MLRAGGSGRTACSGPGRAPARAATAAISRVRLPQDVRRRGGSSARGSRRCSRSPRTRSCERDVVADRARGRCRGGRCPTAGSRRTIRGRAGRSPREARAAAEPAAASVVMGGECSRARVDDPPAVGVACAARTTSVARVRHRIAHEGEGGRDRPARRPRSEVASSRQPSPAGPRRPSCEGAHLGHDVRDRAPDYSPAVRHHGLGGRDDHRVVRLLPVRRPRRVLLHPVLPEGQRHRGPAGVARDVRCRLRRPAVRGRVLRPDRRPDRPQVHVPR